MERTLIDNIGKSEGKEVNIYGRALNVRELGEIVFVQVQDYSGTIQCVFEKKTEIKTGDAVEITGRAKKEERAKGGYEVHATSEKIISTSTEDLPIDLSKSELKLQLETLLNLRALSLRHPKVQAIFKLFDIVLKSYSTVMRELGFTEIKTPKLLSAASEGGADFFKVDYFEKSAYLAQSPQFYKQIMVGSFERVFEVGPVFRAEPHFTTRHVNEYISLDAEMGFIKDYKDVTRTLNDVLIKMFKIINSESKLYMETYSVKPVKVPEEIPYIKLAEAKKIIKEKYDYDVPKTTDIDPEGERLICRYAKEEFDSDFIFVTHYPWDHRPFYTMPDKENPGETYGFDLLFRGVELVTGSQRIHDYKMLIENMKKKGLKSEGMEFYLETFKFAMPPHGGWAIGCERLVQLTLGLKSVKEATLFPRDVKRLSP
ncbi:MAG: aspartate--tRNA(Asn) ligase [Candidatus Berkelbacteria bacterium]|nr:aspartate--tRNA(Asn) ligase [Candidatus Berkelbacteria bacterium]